MLDAYPGLKKMYRADDDNTEVFYFKNAVYTIPYLFNSFKKRRSVLLDCIPKSGSSNHEADVRFPISENELQEKLAVFGHTPTSHYQNNNPLEIWHSRGGDQIGIDCGCGYPPAEEQISHPVYGRLACLRLDDMKVFYSEEEIPEKVEEVLW